jgi:hypothetical protein|tara:strand:- start:349 stop:1101 length:753 start_codon:yes stop_codon:yes gene_type:complete
MAFLYNPKNEALLNREQLSSVVTPDPIGRFHRPVDYSDFVQMIDNKLVTHDLQIADEKFAVKHDGSQFFGLMQISTPAMENQDWTFNIGIRGSHDGRISRGIAFGSSVLVCSNMCFHGDLGVFRTRQTLNVMDRLPSMIDGAIAKIPSMVKENLKRFDGYRTTKMTESDGNNALVHMHRGNILSANQLSTALNEWIEPSHDEHNEDGATLWRLFNAATEAIKPKEGQGNMVTLQNRSHEISNFADTLILN